METTTGKMQPTPAKISAASRLKVLQSTNRIAASHATISAPPIE